MFLSIKWKAVLFLSIILLFITTSWLISFTSQSLEEFQRGSEAKQQRYQTVFNEIVHDNFLKLSQFAQLIANAPEVYSYSSFENDATTVNDYVRRNWFDWNLNLSVDFVDVVDPEYNLLVEDSLFTSSKNLYKQLAPFLKTIENNPQHFIFCQTDCIQVVIEPFVYQSGLTGAVVIGQNMTELVTRYSALSGEDLAILLKADNDNSSELQITTGDGVSKKVWAMSNFEQLAKVITRQYPLPANLDDYSLFQALNLDYIFHRLTLDNYLELGEKASFIGIYSERPRIALLEKQLLNGASFFLLIMFFSAIVLLILSLGAVKRIKQIAASQNLIPQKNYQQALALVSHPKDLVEDEISHLEHSTVELVEELRYLNEEVDISNAQLNHQLRRLSRSKAFLQRLFDHANIFIITSQANYHIQTQNRLFENYFDEKQGGDLLELMVKDFDKDNFRMGVEQLFTKTEDDFQQEVVMLNQFNKYMTIVWTHSLVTDDEGEKKVLSIGVDITQRKADEKALYWIANHDSLTKLWNRRAFKEKLNSYLSEGEHGAVVFIDINRFKQINDVHGHGAGDDVLVEVASILKTTLRSHDFICRLAGDEFTAILPGVTSENLPRIMLSLYKNLSSHVVTPEDKLIEFDVSVGAALFPDHGELEEQLVARADMAMYHSKKESGVKWHIYDQNDDSLEELKRDQRVTSLLKTALQEDAFTQVFQPTYSIKDGLVNHYECLLRFSSAEDGDISPGLFIPIAERNGLISRIDFWVIENLYKKFQVWLQEQPDLTIGLNISAPTLQGKTLYKDLLNLNQKYQVPPQNVVIELTETAYIDDFYNVKANLEALNEEGFRIALDDFGVGFSSFNYLRELPLTYVKLDGSYVNGIAKSTENQAFIKSVVIMAKEFEMQTIAEYVETVEDLRAITDLGVDYAQGYLLGKPKEGLLSEKEIAKLKALIG